METKDTRVRVTDRTVETMDSKVGVSDRTSETMDMKVEIKNTRAVTTDMAVESKDMEMKAKIGGAVRGARRGMSDLNFKRKPGHNYKSTVHT